MSKQEDYKLVQPVPTTKKESNNNNNLIGATKKIDKQFLADTIKEPAHKIVPKKMLRFYLLKTQELNYECEPVGEAIIELHVSNNSYDINITSVHSIEEAESLVEPNNILDTLNTNLSQNELLMFDFEELKNYSFYNKNFSLVID